MLFSTLIILGTNNNNWNCLLGYSDCAFLKLSFNCILDINCGHYHVIVPCNLRFVMKIT